MPHRGHAGERSQLMELYGADPAAITVIPPGVDLSRFRPIEQNEAKHLIGIPGWRKNILFTGRIEPLKGIDTLLGALALLRERHPGELDNVCVTIIGGNPWADTLDEEMARLHGLREQLGLHDLVTFAGSRDQDLLPYYYAAAGWWSCRPITRASAWWRWRAWPWARRSSRPRWVGWRTWCATATTATSCRRAIPRRWPRAFGRAGM
ncbi:MAG: glycosyltransferase [Caldilineaceae bacterium]